MKKAFVITLSLALLLSLAACNKPQAEDQTDSNATISSQTDVSIPEPDSTPDPEPPVTQAPEQITDTTPAVPAENDASQDQAEPAAQEPVKPEPVKTEAPKQTTPPKTDTPPAETKPAEPEPADQESSLPEQEEQSGQDGQESNSGWTLTGFQEPEDPNDAPKTIYEAWPGYDGPREGYVYVPGLGYRKTGNGIDTGITLPSWEEVMGNKD